MKIVLCGGHLTPALALIEQLKRKKDIEIIFFGRKFATEGSENISQEARSVQKEGITFIPITTGRFQRKFTKYTLFSIFKIPVGFFQSFFNLIKFRPDLIISFGSYQSVPPVICGWLLGIDSITHEQSIVPGLATKINSLFAKKVFLTWGESKKYFDTPSGNLFESEHQNTFPQSRRSEERSDEGSKFQVIGNLTRPSILKYKPNDPKLGKFLEKAKNLIFITGGNQGSHFLNQLAFQLLPHLKNYSIIHQIGTTNFKGDLDRARQISRSNYFSRDFFDQDIGAIFKRADFIISRSGANTVWDLAILAKVAILIPLPHSASGEQQANAQIMESKGTSIVIKQEEATKKRLLTEIRKILTNRKKYQDKANLFAQELKKDATVAISRYI